MDKFYEYQIIAKIGDEGIQDLGNRTSINDEGVVAFTGDLDTSTFGNNTVFVGSGSSLTNVAKLSNLISSTRKFSTPVQINNAGQVIAGWTSQSNSEIILFDSQNLANADKVAGGGVGIFDFGFVLPLASVNNSGESVFTGYSDSNLTNSLLITASDKLRSLPLPPNVNPVTLQPIIADNGNFVVKFGTKDNPPVLLFDNNLNVIDTIASSDKFNQLGSSPGISDNGQVVVFYAQEGDENGIFAWHNGKTIRIAGISGNGVLEPGETHDDRNANQKVDLGEDVGLFKSFNSNSRVAVSLDTTSPDGKSTGLVTYIASDSNGQKGIYTSSFQLTDTLNLDPIAPKLVAKVGDEIPGLGTIKDLNTYDPINKSGQIAFWADTTGGEAIIRAQNQFDSINLFPLRVKGNFLDDDKDGNFEANGTILIGRADGIFPLISLEGEAKYNNQVFSAEGEVFSAIQNASYTNDEIINKSLFTGKFDIDIGKSSTNETQFKETKVVSEDAKIGGLDVEFTSLDLQKKGISLDGNFTLPENIGGLNIPGSINPLGGLEIEAKETDALFIGKQGIGFGSESGKIKVPFGETNIFDFTGITSGAANLAYTPNKEKLDIQGKFILRGDLLELVPGNSLQFSKFILDLEGEGLSPKSIQIKDGIADIDAVIKAKDTVLKLPLGFEFTDFEAALKSSQGKLSDVVGKTKVSFPWRKISVLPESIAGEIEFKRNNSTVIDENDAPFVVDDVVIEFEGSNIPIKSPFLYLNDMKGGIKNLTPVIDENIEYVGGIGLSIGPQIKFKPPTFLGIDVLDKVFDIDLSNGVSLAKIKLEIESGFQEIQKNENQESELVALGGKAGLSIINEKIIQLEAELKWNWAKELFEASGTGKIFNGILEGNKKVKIDYDDTLSLVLSAKGQLKVPDSRIFLGARGKTFAEANATAIYTDNDNDSDDVIAAWATFTLPNATPYTVGLKTSFDGDFSRITSTKEIPPIGSWNVEDGTSWLMLTATWENPTSNNILVRVKNPDGNFIDENDFAANNIDIVDELSGAYSKTIIVNNPTVGIWDYVLVDDTGLGEIQYTASRDSIAPSIEIAATSVNESKPEINIAYKAFDGDSDAEISLFYDTDNQDFDGIVIAQGIAETDGQGSFTWNPEGLAPGEYFIYAAIFDENNAPVFSYSTEKIQVLPDVDENSAPIITSDTTFSIAENTTIVGTITVTDADSDNLNFSINDGDDRKLFTINNNGELSFKTAPDFETIADTDADRNYQVQVAVSDGSETVTQNLTVSIINVNETPIANDATFTVDENSDEETQVAIIAASDPEDEDLTFAIVNGNLDLDNDSNLAFAINPSTGVITVNDSDDLEFETTPTFNLEVTATDASGLSDTAQVTINLNDVSSNQFDIPQSQNGIFTLNGENVANIKFNLTDHYTENVNEIGLFIVDDESGNINGNTPSSEGYLKAALQRAQVIFSAISNRPNGFDLADIERVIEVAENTRLGFYMISNGTTDTVLSQIQANGTTNLPIFFSNSSSQLEIADFSAEGFKLNWLDEVSGNDLTAMELSVQLTQDAPASFTKLQRETQKELIDLRNTPDKVSVNIEVHREATFDNLIGFYQVLDANGGIDTSGDGVADINPSDNGYKEAALLNRVTGLDLLKTSNQQTNTINGTLESGNILAPFIVIDGTVDEALNNSTEVYFSFLGANNDGVDHIRLLGDSTFGFEDLAGGGDLDYNDMIIKLNFTTV